MGIYNSNAYNPMGAIQAALNNVNEKNRIKNEYWKRNGEIWSNFAKEMGSMGGRLVDAYQANKESPEARLAALEQERNEAIYNQQVEQRKDVNDYLMSGRVVPAYNDNYGFSVAQDATNSMDGYAPSVDMNDYAQYLRNTMGGVYRR